MAGDLDALALSLGGIATRLREIGEDGLARDLSDAISRAVRPVPGQIRAGLRPHLPNRYADVLDADLRIFRRTYTQPDGARVTLYATTKAKRRKLQQHDDGILWHPLFGRFPRRDPRNRWFEQDVRPGWFSDPVREAAPRVREEISNALDEIVIKAVGA